jgi:hypothetical protein
LDIDPGNGRFWREAVISIYFDLSSIGRAVELVVF